MASVNLQEKANFTRLSRLLVDKGTEALRNTLDAIHPPANLPAVLNANRTTLLKLKPRVINNAQWDLLFPPSGIPPDSKIFDVTLLAVILRNLSGFPPPATGWNTMPPDTDNSPQANITRIKLFRNEVHAHASSTQVNVKTFENLWKKISKALVDLKIPQKEIDDLQTCPLGPEEEIYVQTLKEWYLEEEDSKDILVDLQQHMYHSNLQRQDDSQSIKRSMQHLTRITEGNRQGIQQLCQSSSRESENERPTSVEVELLQKLAKHNFKSKIRRRFKLFQPCTRDWLLKDLETWYTTEDESRVLLLTAGPGFGKSVFAAKVCELFREKGKFAACHFYDFSNSNLKDPVMLLESLASQMCENVPGFEEKLLGQLRRHHQVRNLNDAFQIYLQNPLDDLKGEAGLVVIDGLDESATDNRSHLVKLIADNFPDLPDCVKVMVTSRPELSLERLRHVKRIKIEAYNSKNELDILEYLKVGLPRLAARDKANQLTDAHPSYELDFRVLPAIVKKCEGSFLYAFHVKEELLKREDLGSMTLTEIMSFLPEGMGSVYQAYFHRLEIELEAVMNKAPDLFKILKMLVGVKDSLPLKFIARALDLDPDCREVRKVINKVNEAVSCLLYVLDDLVTVFHKSVYDWVLANGDDAHEYTVKVSDGEKQLWLICEKIFEEIKRNVTSEHNLKLTSDVKHALEYGHKYLLASNMKDSFCWLVDMIIVHVLSTIYPKTTRHLQNVLEEVLRSDVAITLQLRQRMSWHLGEIKYVENHEIFISSEFRSERPYSYLESVIDHSPEGCFTDYEQKIAEVLLAKAPRCVRRNSVVAKTMSLLLAKLFRSIITAVGVSSNKTLVAIALQGGTICVLSLPKLVKLWEYSTQYECISCCTFAPDDSFILYGRLETALNIAKKKGVPFFKGKVETFKTCAFSPNSKRLVTSNGSTSLKLWDVVRQSLIYVLSAGVLVDYCCFSITGLFIIGDRKNSEEDTCCVWDSITFQRVDQRWLPVRKFTKRDGVLRSERCNRCFRQESRDIMHSRGILIVTSVRLGRFRGYIDKENQYNKSSYGIYNGVDCIFFFEKQSLRVIECTHFTTLEAWEIFIRHDLKVRFVDITAIVDDLWLYADEEKLIIFSPVPFSLKEHQSSLSHPTRVLWCSFSPDGTRLATCTLDGFINLWNVDMCQVYQRFQSNNGRKSPAACWWSDKHLFVCHLIGKVASLSKYPFDDNFEITTIRGQPVPLCPVMNDFSEIQDFSEGYLSFECGRTKPAKVFDVNRIDHARIVVLPGIRPMMSIAISASGSFVLGAGYECFLWKRNGAQSAEYKVFLCFNIQNPIVSECCFGGDLKFAVVFVLKSCTYGPPQRHFYVIDVDTGVYAMKVIEDNVIPESLHLIPKVFCTNTVIFHVTANLIEIFDLESWKRLGTSFQRHVGNNVVIPSKLSPKGGVLAVPKVTGDMEFFQLTIPERSSVSNGLENWERLSGIKFFPLEQFNVKRLPDGTDILLWKDKPESETHGFKLYCKDK